LWCGDLAHDDFIAGTRLVDIGGIHFIFLEELIRDYSMSPCPSMKKIILI
jgi:hypothetical protein